MNEVASVIADLVIAGVDAALVGRVAAALAAREAVLIPDEQAQKRRERDRERQRVRRNPQTSAESADKGSEQKVSLHPSKTQPPKLLPSPPKGAHGFKNRFPEFWLACRRKRGKGGAEKAYLKAIREIGGDDPHGVLMVALAAIDREWANLEIEHVPYPATWLNDRRWEDEIVPNGRGAVPTGPMTPEQFAAWREHATA